MRRKFDLYRRLIAVQIKAQLQYPSAFALEMLSNGIILALYFLSLALVFNRFGSIAGWSLGEVAFLWGLTEASFGLMDMVFSGFDPDTFSGLVRQGGFDQMLLRPVGVNLQVFGSRFVVRRWGRIIEGMVIFIFALSMVNIHWTLAKMLYLPVVIASQMLFFGGIFIVGSTITFWTVQPVEAVNIFTYGGAELNSYPMTVYPNWVQRFFTFIVPAAFLNYYPALFLLDRPAPPVLPFLAPAAGVFVIFAALRFWRFGLAHYQSTGS